MKKIFKGRKKTPEAVADGGATAEKPLKAVRSAVKRRKNTKAGDIPLLVCVFLMACFGCLMIYSEIGRAHV